MENTNALKMVDEKGWRSGFANLFKQASGSWWRTRKWLIQTIIWLVMLNGSVASQLWKDPAAAIAAAEKFKTVSTANLTPMQVLNKDPIGMILIMFVILMGMALPIAAIIFGQDAIIGERQSGTAAWVLSKPVTRPAFILSRLAAGAVGILVTGVVIQGVVLYAQLSLLFGTPWPIAGFLGAMGLMVLLVLFSITLTFMLGTIFKNRGPIMGISLFLALAGPSILVKLVPFLGSITPWSFIMDDPLGNTPMALTLMLGHPIPIAPVISTVVLCVVFTAVAILRFQREEF